MRVALAIAIVGTAFFSGSAFAQTAAEKLACKADYEKFCNGVEPGGDRVIQCLAKELDKLSPDCQAVVKAHMPQ